MKVSSGRWTDQRFFREGRDPDPGPGLEPMGVGNFRVDRQNVIQQGRIGIIVMLPKDGVKGFPFFTVAACISGFPPLTEGGGAGGLAFSPKTAVSAPLFSLRALWGGGGFGVSARIGSAGIPFSEVATASFLAKRKFAFSDIKLKCPIPARKTKAKTIAIGIPKYNGFIIRLLYPSFRQGG